MENKFIPLCCAAAISGFASGQLCVLILNSIPSKWLCDYGETPGAELNNKRFSSKRHGLISGCVLAAAFTFYYLNYNSEPVTIFLYCLVTIALVLSAISDIKYEIIPDQFSAFIAISGIMYYIYMIAARQYFDRISPFIGAICGGGLWIILGIIGKAIYHEDSIGFGDVKLFTAAGFILGFPHAITAFILTIITAGAVFSAMLLLKKIDGKSCMPMAPYICAACITVLAFKKYILSFAEWYISLLR